MTKAKPKKPIRNGEHLSEWVHPKDTTNGMIFRIQGMGCTFDAHRCTVHLSVGGVIVEMTIDSARKFMDQIYCAIECAKRAADSATGAKDVSEVKP